MSITSDMRTRSPDIRSKHPRNEYYKTFYGNVDKNLDIALACIVIFDEIILPAIDIPVPGATDSLLMDQPDLTITGDWNDVNHAQGLIRGHEHELLEDPVIRAVLRRTPQAAREWALIYAAADVVLATAYKAPIICAPGRMRIVARLMQLGAVPSTGFDIESFATSATVVAENVIGYANVTCMTFNSEDIPTLAQIKWNEGIRRYAQGFQRWLYQNETPDEQHLWEAVAEAKTDAVVARGLSGYFKAASWALSLISLLPGVGTFTGALAIGGDVASVVQERKVDRIEWHQLGPEIERYRSQRKIDEELSRRGLF